MARFGKIFRETFGDRKISEAQALRFEKADLFNKYEDVSQEVYGTNYRELSKAKKVKIRHKVYGDPNWKSA